MSFLVIRARSDRGVTRKIRETMAMLNLTRVNHATIVMDNPSYRGMLQKSKEHHMGRSGCKDHREADQGEGKDVRR